VRKRLSPLWLVLAAGCATAHPTPASPEDGVPGATSSTGDRFADRQDLSDEACRSLLAVDVARSPYRLEVPPDLSDGQPVVGRYKLIVDRQGAVFGVEVVERPRTKGVIGVWIRKLMTWRYRPRLAGGQPIPFTCPVRIEER
jgi:hypothetical protein